MLRNSLIWESLWICLVFSNEHRPDVGVARLQEADQFLGVLRLLLCAVFAVADDYFGECGLQLLAEIIAGTPIQHAHDLPMEKCGEKLRNFVSAPSDFWESRKIHLETITWLLRSLLMFWGVSSCALTVEGCWMKMAKKTEARIKAFIFKGNFSFLLSCDIFLGWWKCTRSRRWEQRTKGIRRDTIGQQHIHTPTQTWTEETWKI